MKKIILLLIVSLTYSVSVVHAKDRLPLLLGGGLKALIATKDEFYIEYDDQVTDGCLPQPSRVKDQLEIALRQNNFNIVEDQGVIGSTITIAALGYKTGDDYCAVHLSVTLTHWNGVLVPYAQDVPSGKYTIAPIRHEIGSTLLTGPRNSMQSRLEKKARAFGEDIFLYISRSRDYIQNKFPEILQNYRDSK